MGRAAKAPAPWCDQSTCSDLLTTLAGYADGKSVTPVIEGVYSLDDIAAAHRALETSGGFGEHVIQVA